MGEHRAGKECRGKGRECWLGGERVRCVIFRVSYLSLSSSSACCLESWSASFNCSSSSLGSVGRACSTFCSVLRLSLSELCGGGGEVHV